MSTVTVSYDCSSLTSVGSTAIIMYRYFIVNSLSGGYHAMEYDYTLTVRWKLLFGFSGIFFPNYNFPQPVRGPPTNHGRPREAADPRPRTPPLPGWYNRLVYTSVARWQLASRVAPNVYCRLRANTRHVALASRPTECQLYSQSGLLLIPVMPQHISPVAHVGLRSHLRDKTFRESATRPKNALVSGRRLWIDIKRWLYKATISCVSYDCADIHKTLPSVPKTNDNYYNVSLL